MNIYILLLLFLIIFNLTYCMRSNDFCIPKEEECKGLYDNHHQYQTQCNTLKCNGD